MYNSFISTNWGCKNVFLFWENNQTTKILSINFRLKFPFSLALI